MLTEVFRFIVAFVLFQCLDALPAAASLLFGDPGPTVATASVPEPAAVLAVAIPSLVQTAEAATAAAPAQGTSGRVSATSRVRATTGAAHGRSRGQREACMASTGEVHALGGGSYQVQRSMLDRYMRDADAAASLGNAAWHKNRSGEVDGIRVLRVRCGSPLADAGLVKGDVVRSANGRPLDSMAGMLSLWWQLRTKDQVVLELTRGGERRSLTYRLV